MQPAFHRYFISFDIPSSDNVGSTAVDQINTTQALVKAGAISQATARGLLESVLNPASHVRDALLTNELHEFVQSLTPAQMADFTKLSDEQVVKLWKNNIDERTMVSNFNAPPLMVMPVYYLVAPPGYDADQNVIAVIKTMLSEGHKFAGKIYGVLKTPFQFETTNRLAIQLLQFRPPQMSCRFEDEGDAIVVTSLKDQLDQDAAMEMETIASGARSNLGLGSGAVSNAKLSPGALSAARQMSTNPVGLGVSSRGWNAQKKTP